MRTAFIQKLLELAAQDPRILLLTGDLGYTVVERFVEAFPQRFVNVGAAEQNMIGLATGLAEAGFVPFVYSIAPFAVLRPFEFIRNGPVYHQLPVRIVGVGQGVEYGLNGHTHFGVDDVGTLRTQPGLAIIAPTDDAQTRAAVEKTRALPGPVYFRLSKDSFEIPELGGAFDLAQAQWIGSGADVLLISSGAITRETLEAARLLEAEGLGVTMLIVASIAPAPLQDLVDALSRFRRVFTVEAHYITGGVGSLVAEVIAGHGLNVRLVRLGFETLFDDRLGSASFLHSAHGLSAAQIAARVKETIHENA